MELDEDVLEMVRSQLEREPPPPTTALYGRAAAINSDIYELSLRQFHAKYPLRIKRERAQRTRSADAGAGTGASPDADGDARTEADDGVRVGAGRRHLYGEDGHASDDVGEPGGTSRRRGRERAGRAETGDPAGEERTRAHVRRVLWRLARDVADAERPEKLVGIVERMPDRVDEIARILSTRPSGA